MESFVFVFVGAGHRKQDLFRDKKYNITYYFAGKFFTCLGVHGHEGQM
jgi:hypothetical protein